MTFRTSTFRGEASAADSSLMTSAADEKIRSKCTGQADGTARSRNTRSSDKFKVTLSEDGESADENAEQEPRPGCERLLAGGKEMGCLDYEPSDNRSTIHQRHRAVVDIGYPNAWLAASRPLRTLKDWRWHYRSAAGQFESDGCWSESV